MQAVTAERIRAISQADWATLGYPEGEDPDTLDALILPVSSRFVLRTTGHGTYDVVPSEDAPLVELAIRLASEMFAAQSSPDYLETLADFDLIQAFSAGSYSETRRSADDADKARKMLAAWPPLNAALLGAMTPEAREAYNALVEGEDVPAFAVTPVDWGYGPAWGYGGYDYGGYRPPGWDY